WLPDKGCSYSACGCRRVPSRTRRARHGIVQRVSARSIGRYPQRIVIAMHLEPPLVRRAAVPVILLWLTAAVLVAGCAGPRPSAPQRPPAAPAPQPGPRAVEVNGYEQRVIEATNAFRNSRGL